MSTFDPVEWFAKQGITGYRDDIDAYQTILDRLIARGLGGSVAAKVCFQQIEETRQEAFDRYDDYRTDPLP